MSDDGHNADIGTMYDAPMRRTNIIKNVYSPTIDMKWSRYPASTPLLLNSISGKFDLTLPHLSLELMKSKAIK